MTEDTEVNFKINNEAIKLVVPLCDSDTLFKLTNDDEFTSRYIIDLINNGFLSLSTPLETIYRVDDFGNEETLIYPANDELVIRENSPYSELSQASLDTDFNQNSTHISNTVPRNTNCKQLCEWSEEETRMLLDQYEKYMSKVGPMKKFKNKKCMWIQIANDLNKHFKMNKTAVQVENRYKTVLKRKKCAVDNNNKSGASRILVPFEAELNKISVADDSIEPEVVGTARGIKILKHKYNKDENPSDTPSSSSTPKRTHNKTVQETLIEIFQRKEEAKERRYREKLELIKEIFGGKKNE